MSRLSEYAAIATLLGPETFPVVDAPGVAGGTKKITAANAAVALAVLAPGAWTAPTFTGTWVNFGGTNQVAQYRKVGDRVEIRGVIKTGTIATAAFTLPVGFRPPANGDLTFATVSNALFGAITITAAGVVTPAVGSNVSFHLNCSFSVTA